MCRVLGSVWPAVKQKSKQIQPELWKMNSSAWSCQWHNIAPLNILLLFSFLDSIGIFLRWSRSSKYLDEAYEEMVNIIEYNKELQAKVNILRRQLAELETEDGLRESPWKTSPPVLRTYLGLSPSLLLFALQFTVHSSLELGCRYGILKRYGFCSTARWKSLTYTSMAC